jgi:hypothetical protein
VSGKRDPEAHSKHASNGRPTGWHSLLCEENGSVLKCSLEEYFNTHSPRECYK